MSIRARILLILLSALLLSFIVSALAYFHVNELDARVGLILDSHLPAADAAISIRDDILEVRSLEDQLIATHDVSRLQDMEGRLNRASLEVQRGASHLSDPGLKPRWMEMERQISTLRAQERRLSELVNTEIREIQGRQRRLGPRVSSLRRQIEVLEGRLDKDAQGGGDAGRELQRLLTLVRNTEYNAALMDLYSMESQRGAFQRVADELQDSADVFFGALSTVPSSERLEVQRELLDVVENVREVDRRVTDVNDQLVALREETRLTQDRLLRIASSSEREQWRLVQGARDGIARRRTLAGYVILFFLVGGVLFVSGLTFFVLRSVVDSTGRLLRASRKLRMGDLSVRVELRGRDELQELGSSFNAMAEYLQRRRVQQGHYNEMVSLLNSSLGVEETLRAFLPDVVRRTRSDLGAVYLVEQGGQRLRLVEGFALSREMLRRDVVELGEGIVGQVAQTRRMALVEPVPVEMFRIHTGVGEMEPGSVVALPLVHLDVLLGVLVLGATRVYSVEEQTFLQEVVVQLAVSVSNARFYQTIEETAEALQSTNGELVVKQQALERANDQLAEANRLKSEFLANVTHELRTPLNSIMGYTELVLDSDGLGARHERNLRTVLRNADNLLRLINDLLDISRMESSSEVTLSLERFDVGELVEEVVELAQPMAGAKSLELSAVLADGAVSMFSDRTRCKQILVNLVGNAIKFTDAGYVSVELEALPQEDSVLFRVRDSGIGIRAEDLPLIFEKFRQIDGGASRKYGGAGLGLAITQRLCGFLRGEVSASSVPGEGSVFTVKLPMNSRQGALVGGEGDEVAPAQGSRPVLLVLDEDPTTVGNLRDSAIARSGVEVMTAFTGRDAVDILSRFKPLAVVVGSSLPEADGSATMAEVWQRIKALRLPVLLIWDGEGEIPSYGYPAGGRGEVSTATMTRVIGCVARPVDPEEVLGVLGEAGLDVGGGA